MPIICFYDIARHYLKNMKVSRKMKKLTALLMALAIAVSLTGCWTDASPKPTPTTTTTAPTTTGPQLGAMYDLHAKFYDADKKVIADGRVDIYYETVLVFEQRLDANGEFNIPEMFNKTQTMFKVLAPDFTTELYISEFITTGGQRLGFTMNDSGSATIYLTPNTSSVFVTFVGDAEGGFSIAGVSDSGFVAP